jgi:hypothetical protein
MIPALLREKAGVFAFALAAFFAPLATLVPGSCGAACGGCPLAGGCLAIPVVAAGIGAFSCGPRFRALAGRIREGRVKLS